MPAPEHRRPGRNLGRAPLPERPLPSASGVEHGWTRDALRHGIDAGDLVRPRRGIVGPAPPAPIERPRWQARRDAHIAAGRAAAVSSPRAVLSHASAAVAWGLPVLGLPERPCLSVPAGTALRRVARAHLHRATLTADDLARLGADLVTAPARTVIDLARELGVDAGVVAADAALHDGLVESSALIAAVEQCAGWPGRRRAVQTLCAADGLAESPLESLSRLRLAAHGLPAARTQVPIHDAAGRFLGRCDFYWDEYGVVGEADGELKYDTTDAVRAERLRQQSFEHEGLIVVRWGWVDLRRFEAAAHRVYTALARGARPDSPLRRWRIPPLHPLAGLPSRGTGR